MALTHVDAEAVPRIVERWLASEHTLIRRIAVHVAGYAPGLTKNDRLRFVLDHDLAPDSSVAQEVLHLLGAAAPGADEELVDRLVAVCSPTSDEEAELRRAFDWLEPLERAGVDNVQLASALAQVRSGLPEGLQGSPYPGMSSWMEVGFRSGGVQPLTPEAFDSRVREDPSGAVQFVLSFEPSVFPRAGETTLVEAAQMLRDTVLARPGAGVELWPHLNGHPALLGTVLQAWGRVTETDQAGAIMDLLAAADFGPVLDSVGQFLMTAERADGPAWETFPATELFLDRVWSACATQAVYGSHADRDWVSRTFNEPAGVLMGFWFEMFRRRWAAAGDNWTGMSESEKEFLNRALADRTERGALAQTEISARLHFLDMADTDWCHSQLLPQGDWGQPLIAEPFWWGVLSFARWNDRLVAGGLLDGLIETSRHLTVFGEEQAGRWAGLLASIAMRCEVPPAASWVESMTAKASVKDRARWMVALGHELEGADFALGSAVWSSWLAQYWTQRTRGAPAVLTVSEAEALAVVATHLPTEEFLAALPLVEATPAGLSSHAEVSGGLPDDLIDSHPVEVGRFLTHLMAHTETSGFWGGYFLTPKLERITSHPGDWEKLREAALRLGIDAP